MQTLNQITPYHWDFLYCPLYKHVYKETGLISINIISKFSQ